MGFEGHSDGDDDDDPVMDSSGHVQPHQMPGTSPRLASLAETDSSGLDSSTANAAAAAAAAAACAAAAPVAPARAPAIAADVTREASISSVSSAGSGAAGGAAAVAAALPPCIARSGTSSISSSCYSWGDAPDALTRGKTAASLWELDFDEIEILRKIGEGSFGEVLLGMFRGTKVMKLAGS